MKAPCFILVIICRLLRVCCIAESSLRGGQPANSCSDYEQPRYWRTFWRRRSPVATWPPEEFSAPSSRSLLQVVNALIMISFSQPLCNFSTRNPPLRYDDGVSRYVEALKSLSTDVRLCWCCVARPPVVRVFSACATDID
jgi:hypothetical protein